MSDSTFVPSSGDSAFTPLIPSTVTPVTSTQQQRQTSDHGHSHGHGGGHSHSHGGGHAHNTITETNIPSIEKRSIVPLINNSRGSNFGNSFILNQPKPIEWNFSLIINLFFTSDSRPLTCYLTLKLFYTLLLFSVGLSLRLTSLISSSFHVLFDCFAMLCSLYSIIISRQKSSFIYSYGYSRFEVVSAFTNAIFLYFVATFLTIELFHELTAGESNDDGNTSHKIVHQIIWFGLCIDCIGIVLFMKWAILNNLIQITPTTTLTTSAVTTSSATSTLSSLPSLPLINPGHDVNMHSIWLFTVSDCIQHCLFLASTYLPSMIRSSLPLTLTSSLSSSHLHSLSYAMTAMALIKLTTPLFKVTGRVLLQSTEDAARVALERAIREISFGDGVLEVRQANFWSQSPMSATPSTTGSSSIIGSVIVRCRSDCDSQAVLSDVHNCLGKLCSQLTVQIEKDSAPAWLTSNIT